MKKIIPIICMLVTPYLSEAQATSDSIIKPNSKNLKFNTKQLIIPAALMAYGVVAIESDYLKLINTELRDELRESIDDKFTIDDFSQYAPAASVYLLNNLGIKGRNNLRDRSVILADRKSVV